MAKRPEIACTRDRFLWSFWNVIRVRLAGRCRQRQYVVEREDVQVVQPGELVREQVCVSGR